VRTREGLDIAALPLGIEGVEHQRALAGPRDPRHHDQFTGRDVEIELARLFWRAPRIRIVRRVSSDTSLESADIGAGVAARRVRRVRAMLPARGDRPLTIAALMRVSAAPRSESRLYHVMSAG